MTCIQDRRENKKRKFIPINIDSSVTPDAINIVSTVTPPAENAVEDIHRLESPTSDISESSSDFELDSAFYGSDIDDDHYQNTIQICKYAICYILYLQK